MDTIFNHQYNQIKRALVLFQCLFSKILSKCILQKASPLFIQSTLLANSKQQTRISILINRVHIGFFWWNCSDFDIYVHIYNNNSRQNKYTDISFSFFGSYTRYCFSFSEQNCDNTNNYVSFSELNCDNTNNYVSFSELNCDNTNNYVSFSELNCITNSNDCFSFSESNSLNSNYSVLYLCVFLHPNTFITSTEICCSTDNSPQRLSNNMCLGTVNREKNLEISNCEKPKLVSKYQCQSVTVNYNNRCFRELTVDERLYVKNNSCIQKGMNSSKFKLQTLCQQTDGYIKIWTSRKLTPSRSFKWCLRY